MKKEEACCIVFWGEWKSQYLQLFKQLIDWGIDTGSYINVYLDPLDVPGMKGFISICDYIAENAAQLSVLRYEDLIRILDQA